MDLKEVYEELKKDFPPEAYSVDSSRGFDLTSLKAQYAIERLNDVLGINGWSITGEFTEKDNGVLFLGKLSLLNDGQELHSVEAIGFSEKKKNLGDAYKGARTDALSKAASYYGLGNDMFKGKIKAGRTAKPAKKFEKPTSAPKESKKGVSSGKAGTGFRRGKKSTTDDDL